MSTACRRPTAVCPSSSQGPSPAAPLLWSPQAPFFPLPDSPGDLSGKHRASFVFLYLPTPPSFETPHFGPHLTSDSPLCPSQPLSHLPSLKSPPLTFLPTMSCCVNLPTSQSPLKPICFFTQVLASLQPYHHGVCPASSQISLFLIPHLLSSSAQAVRTIFLDRCSVTFA